MDGTATTDLALLTLLLAAGGLSVLVLHLTSQALRALQPTRPVLPDDDQAPADLGRLVPTGAQLEQECRRGLVALELWLVAHRRRQAGPAPAPRVPVQRDPRRLHHGTASEAG